MGTANEGHWHLLEYRGRNGAWLESGEWAPRERPPLGARSPSIWRDASAWLHWCAGGRVDRRGSWFGGFAGYHAQTLLRVDDLRHGVCGIVGQNMPKAGRRASLKVSTSVVGTAGARHHIRTSGPVVAFIDRLQNWRIRHQEREGTGHGVKHNA